MQKKTKRVIISSVLVALLAILAGFAMQKKTSNISQIEQENAKATVYTNIGENEIDITNLVEENPMPKFAVGMIPIKRVGENWVITTEDDSEWYDYKAGKPAYMMLNDGVYQTEEYYKMPKTKKLVEQNIGVIVEENELGTIYMWIPRLAYNKNEIVYLKTESMIAGKYIMPDLFTYELGEKQFSLSGVWMQYDSTDTSTLSDATQRAIANRNILETKLQGLNAGKEDETYGFLAYTKASMVLVEKKENNKTVTDTDKTNARLETISSFIREMNELQGENTTTILKREDNTNRTTINVIDEEKIEPLQNATATYDPAGGDAGQIRVEVAYSKNGIAKIIDENGKELNYPNGASDKTVGVTADDVLLGNGVYYYYIIDTYGNMVKARCEVTGSSIYMIKDRETLILFRDAVNGGQSDAIGYQIADVTDLNEEKYTVEEDGTVTFTSDAEQWVPIGKNSNKPFAGKYYGNNYTINGICVSGSYRVGFIGYGKGEITNLNIKNSKINCTTSEAGGFIANVTGDTTIENCSFSGTIDGNGKKMGGILGTVSSSTINISNCTFNGTFSGANNCGGILGDSSSSYSNIEVNNCKSNGKMNLSNSSGGIIGYISSNIVNISNCENNAEINGSGQNIGGIIGNCQGTKRNISNCKNNAIINNSTTYTGGIVGNANSGDIVIEKCVNAGEVNGNERMGGITGNSGGESIKECCNIGNVNGVRYVAGIIGYGGTQIINCYNAGEINATANYVAGIASYGSNTVKYCYNTGSITGTSYTAGIASKITNKTELEYCYNSGNIFSSGSYSGGVFGYIGEYRKTSNVKCLFNTGNVEGGSGIAGYLYYVNLESCYNTGNASGDGTTGGIVGGGESSDIKYCYNIGDVTVSERGQQGGGIVGNQSGVYAVNVYNSYNTGNIYGGGYVGGIAGYISTIQNTYNLGDVSGGSTCAGISSGTYMNQPNWITSINSSYTIGIVTGSSGAITYKGKLSDCGYLKDAASYASSSAGNDNGATRFDSVNAMPTVSDIVGLEKFSSTNHFLFKGMQLPRLTWETNNDKLNLLNLNKTDSDTLFVEDTNNINNGYPILAWQAE